MKPTASPLIIRPGHIRKQQRRPNSGDLILVNHRDRNHHKSSSSSSSSSINPALNYIIGAAKKVTCVLSSIFFRHNNERSNSTEDQVQSSTRHFQAREDSYSLKGSPAYDRLRSSRSTHSNCDALSEADSSQLRGSLTLQEIYNATGNFSAANKIGEGGFGSVYKGELKDGSVIAIKRAEKEMNDQRSSEEFKNEISVLSKIEHRNLVQFYGYLEHGDERLIVVEYVSNGTLRQHLDGTRGNGLETAERLDIAIDIAHAITYLHTYTDPPIIHRDIKASNILITPNLCAKVADFGFARLAAEDSVDTHISTEIKGSAGYLDPEYLKTYQLSEKSDVYSFGVLLVEMMTGRRPIELKRSPNERLTIRWALRRMRDGEVVVAMDQRLRRNVASLQAVENVLKLAKKCLAPSRLSRPSMKTCAEILWEIRKEFKQTTALSLTRKTQWDTSASGIQEGGDSLMFVSE